ncbi:hypothetical protein [Leptospira bouyouniensis]|uniref:Uncharacterized protein n=1 Tax=Leptospira bouyouniensis TaxID=2484911 RepID=A0ABY2L0W2_9LEPT|nr:hypothetical protein [Leptospira bouyouniensis]TGK46917.1 hypothetical protein EHQ10_16365 [Leptospira bouyouniensis]
MWKFPKTYKFNISLEHLPIQETKLRQMVLEWEEIGFRMFLPFHVFNWKTRPEPILHSHIDFDFFYQLSNFESVLFLCFPKQFEKKKKDHVTNILRDKFPSIKETHNHPTFLESIRKWWKDPVQLYFGNLGLVHTRLDMEGIKNPTGFLHLQIHEGESHIVFRVGYLKAIQYRFHLKKFKSPFPKIAECYIKTRDVHNDGSLGNVYDRFLGYLLESQTDEYLLPYFGLRPSVPDFIRELIPEEIWNLPTFFEMPDWVLTNLKAEELQFRIVFQVSTSSQLRLK